MKLFTICVSDLPILVMSTDTELPKEDGSPADPALMKAPGDLGAQPDSLPDDVRRISDQPEIDEALETWLGDDLMHLTHEGKALWNGSREYLSVRESLVDEVARWHSYRKEVVNANDEGGGEESCLVYLIEVVDPAAAN